MVYQTSSIGADATDSIRLPHPHPQAKREPAQQLVADVQPVLVVQLGEAVDVQQDDRHRVGVAASLSRLDPQSFQGLPAARQPGQLVRAGGPFDLDPLQLDQVSRGDQIVQRGAQLARQSRELVVFGLPRWKLRDRLASGVRWGLGARVAPRPIRQLPPAEHEVGVVGFGAVEIVHHEVAAAGLYHGLESLDRREQVGQVL